MGVLANLLVANLCDARAIEQSIGPTETWEGFDASGLDPVKLSTLQSLVHEVDDSVDPDAEFQLLAGDEEGPWVLGFPQAMTASLATLTPASLLRVTRQWLETDELKMDAWQLQDTRARLTEMQSLAQQAVAQNKDLILWISL